MTDGLRITPATTAPWADLATVFTTPGEAGICFCQFYKVTQLEWDTFEPAQCSAQLRAQTEIEPGPGLVAYLDDEPVGWCGVESKLKTPRLFESPVAAASTQSPDDANAWAVRCFIVREESRHRGVGQALLGAAIDHARANGAHTLEGYPIDTTVEFDHETLFRGTIGMFESAGFALVARPVEGRALMSLAL